jgi:5-methyltetrahydrofolate--homocysteine methyltransferase
MPLEHLLDRIARGPILCDGAMKTQLMAQGVRRGLISTEEASFSTGFWNLEHPDVVEAVHRDYLDAGAELILTNTFKASSFHVFKLGLANTLEDAAQESVRWIDAATRIARTACGDDAWVLGDIGHIVTHMPDPLRRDKKVLREECKRQAQAMRDAGADAIIVEYMADPYEMAVAVEVSKEVAEWPVLATPVFARPETNGNREYRTHRPDRTMEVAGVSIDEMVKAAVDAGADVIGAHCGILLDVSDYLAIAEQILTSPHRPAHTSVIVQPNGSEKNKALGGDTGKARPQALAESVPHFLDLGVRILGGCCGTTPTDVRAMSEAMRRHCKSRNVP